MENTSIPQTPVPLTAPLPSPQPVPPPASPAPTNPAPQSTTMASVRRSDPSTLLFILGFIFIALGIAVYFFIARKESVMLSFFMG